MLHVCTYACVYICVQVCSVYVCGCRMCLYTYVCVHVYMIMYVCTGVFGEWVQIWVWYVCMPSWKIPERWWLYFGPRGVNKLASSWMCRHVPLLLALLRCWGKGGKEGVCRCRAQAGSGAGFQAWACLSSVPLSWSEWEADGIRAGFHH